jgi:hypothetical protein
MATESAPLMFEMKRQQPNEEVMEEIILVEDNRRGNLEAGIGDIVGCQPNCLTDPQVKMNWLKKNHGLMKIKL